MAGLVPAKISDRYAKNEKETFDALTSVLQGEQSHDNVELHEIEVNRLNNDNNNNDEGDPTETHEQRDTGSSRFRSVSNEDTDEFLRKNVNKNTDYKTRSDVKTFYTWAQQVGEFRELQMIPFKELDAILARFYLGVGEQIGIDENYGRGRTVNGRKSIIQPYFCNSLLHSERPPTEVAQLGGWKGISTLTHYNFPSMNNKTRHQISYKCCHSPCSSNQNEPAPENSDKDTVTVLI
ncbi:Hypothetical predicted protein [Mytilus galloprovincialis]|uniref:Uncharacterized protein n=1 Tax=Mytilus galloprovincialis TaxID=29158 RepID=A0A8B6C7J6_MYTGA|nr:Hypothetical predicted protein [Mytilus galloprovincialis]